MYFEGIHAICVIFKHKYLRQGGNVYPAFDC